MPDNKREIRYCPNCGEIVDNKFCPSCGQENREYNATLKELISEFFSHAFNLDSRFYHSIKHLVIHPGYLTLQYFKGKRERYTSPLRLYLIISMLYFLTFAIQGFYKDITSAVKLIQSNEINLDSLSVEDIEITPEKPEQENTIRIMNKDFEIDNEKLMDSFMNNVPKIMFFLFPLGAMILKMLYSRKKALFFEHLIFLLHLHSFFFITQIITWVLPFTLVEFVIAVILIWYVIKSFLNYYHQPAGKTILKICIFSFLYSIILAFLMLINVLLSSASMLV